MGQSMESRINRCHKAKLHLSTELMREPLDEEIATEIGEEVKNVKQWLNLTIEKEPEESSHKHELKFKLTIKNNELEKARLKIGLTQKQIAEKIHISSITYSLIECCKKYPCKGYQREIAELLNESKEKLFPKWLEAFTTKWKDTQKSRIVPINELSLQSPEVMLLENNDYERMMDITNASMIIDKVIPKLTEKEKIFINNRYGLDGTGEKTLEEVGNIYGVTRERVRQIEAKTLEKIRTLIKH